MNLDQFIRQEIKETDIVLDVGCGNRSGQNFKCSKIVSLDAWEAVNPDIVIDLNENSLPFLAGDFDTILMIDFIEHLDKGSGIKRIEEAIKIARSKVIVMTPLWWTDNKQNTENASLWCYKNPYNYHKSLWEIEDFKGFERIFNIAGLEKYFLGVFEHD